MITARRALEQCIFLLVCLVLSHAQDDESIIQVVMVAGQSNCQGLADADHLIELLAARSGDVDSKYSDGSGNVDVRDDVYVYIEPERQAFGPLTATFGDSMDKLGIEMGMGWELGDATENATVFIVKHCEVAALATDWRSPSRSRGMLAGSAYRNARSTFRTVLREIETYFPNAVSVEPLAFVWWHGYADVFEPEYLAEYEENLESFLEDMSSDLRLPESLPTVIVQMGGQGSDPSDEEAQMREIQASVAASRGSQTSLVETLSFAGGDPVDGETFVHYMGRADNYINIGEAVGKSILDLMATAGNDDSSEPRRKRFWKRRGERGERGRRKSVLRRKHQGGR